MRIVRQPCINLVVAICLLLSQQTALVHAITHLGEIPQQRVHATSAEVSANTADAHCDFCRECVVFAQVAAAGTTFSGFIAPGVIHAVVSATTDRRTAQRFHFRARAPLATL